MLQATKFPPSFIESKHKCFHFISSDMRCSFQGLRLCRHVTLSRPWANRSLFENGSKLPHFIQAHNGLKQPALLAVFQCTYTQLKPSGEFTIDLICAWSPHYPINYTSRNAHCLWTLAFYVRKNNDRNNSNSNWILLAILEAFSSFHSVHTFIS